MNDTTVSRPNLMDFGVVLCVRIQSWFRAVLAAQLIGKLEALLGLSIGNQHLQAGQSAMTEDKNFENAIAEYESGLAQKTSERGDDGGLTVNLQAALKEATAAKSAQDTARSQALQYCDAGEAMLTGEIGSDTIEKAIASYEAGLALRELTNGESGWDSCMERLSTNIASATGLKRLQDEARAKAQSDFTTAKTRSAEAAELQDGIDSLTHEEQATKLYGYSCCVPFPRTLRP